MINYTDAIAIVCESSGYLDSVEIRTVFYTVVHNKGKNPGKFELTGTFFCNYLLFIFIQNRPGLNLSQVTTN